jgi:hypothetical protein
VCLLTKTDHTSKKGTFPPTRNPLMDNREIKRQTFGCSHASRVVARFHSSEEYRFFLDGVQSLLF